MSGHRHAEDVGDMVDRKVSRAMRKMEKAMAKAAIAEKEAKRAYKSGRDVPDGVTYTTDKHGNFKEIHRVRSYEGDVIIVNGAGQIKVGCREHVTKGPGGYRDEDSSDEELATSRSRHRHGEPARQEPGVDSNIQRLLHTNPSHDMPTFVTPFTESTRPVNSDDLQTVSQYIGQDWRRVFRNLGLEDETIEEVREDHYVGGLRQIVYEGLMLWSRRQLGTVGALSAVLHRTGQTVALDHLSP
ncbi:uncharacterized protein LOC127869199 isoform X2 [Dreissena polymorpha]|uniref:uncharacterized protein LOC127869199 isoform X2 n=1 Tax=Dreissena polymorpha TaxID=45954 RepID=UPI00226417C0|nr:uncharacterized protein LOC127869199 isoform X2 [Dreissena polymorpha]